MTRVAVASSIGDVARVANGYEPVGRLVWLPGQLSKFEPQALTLNDGSGPAGVYFPADLSWPRPYMQIGLQTTSPVSSLILASINGISALSWTPYIFASSSVCAIAAYT